MIYAFSQAVASAGTAVALKSTRVVCAWATIKALKTSGAANTGNIYVGGSDVSASVGYPLTTGQTLTLEAVAGQNYIDLSTVYIDAGTSNDEVKVVYGIV